MVRVPVALVAACALPDSEVCGLADSVVSAPVVSAASGPLASLADMRHLSVGTALGRSGGVVVPLGLAAVRPGVVPGMDGTGMAGTDIATAMTGAGGAAGVGGATQLELA